MSIGFDPPSAPLDGIAARIVVCLYDSSTDKATKLDNIRCERVEYRMGAVPAAAQFSYYLDNSGSSDASDYPTSFEDVWPLGDASKGLAIGEEIAVFAINDQGEIDLLFHGHVENPQINVTGQGQAATFTASDVSMRCYDTPIGGALMRNSNDPQGGDVIPTSVIARFNPDGKPNATPEGYDVAQGGDTAHPVFLDPTVILDPDQRRYWTLGMMARYLFNTRTDKDLEWVKNPTPHFADATIDDDLNAIYPANSDNGPIDTSDETSFDIAPILVDDVVASDRPWPEVLETTLNRHGFDMRFDVDQEAATSPGDPPIPKHQVILSRADGTFEPDPYDLYLQDGDVLDPNKTNVGQLSAMRDAHGIQNEFAIASKLNRYEVTFVLAPLFPISSSDASDANTVKQFNRQVIEGGTADLRKKYRWYGIDEAGEGHWYFGGNVFSTTPLDLSDIFGDPNKDGTPQYTVRHRPARGETLFTKDDANRPRRVELAISTDYAGQSPAIWDGTGTWQDTGGAGWKLLKDRCGIEITADNPNNWTLAKPEGVPVLSGGYVIRGVEAQANTAPSGSIKRFYLRLTCVIEGDKGLDAKAEKRGFSPSPFTIKRSIEGRDVYEQQVVHHSSIWAANVTATPRDDTQKAKDQAFAFRTQNEFPRVTARVMIPRLSLAYKVGDRIRKIIGREIDFRSNGGSSAKESPRYPTVVGVTFDFSGGKQSTTLELSDGDRVVDRRNYRETNTEEA